MNAFDVIIIGAGPAGIAAAIAAYENGSKRVLLIDRNPHLGGILKQCIHDGFGLLKWNEALTGPEYAARYAELLQNTNVEIQLNTMVTKITNNKEVTCVSRRGVATFSANAIILTTGCRERTRGMLTLPGTRPSGIYTAGAAQKFINIQNIKIGSKAVILGSGDIGLIMARRMTLEGIEVICVLEKLPQLSGLPRNKNLCLDDYNIPLKLNQTIVDIQGNKRLERVIAAEVDNSGRIISGTEYAIPCDTLILSVGLIPENELAKSCGAQIDEATGSPIVDGYFQTTISGIFSAGNSLHIHSLADYASEEGAKVGTIAAKYAQTTR
jgi:NADPH-dependent 2,4-dienoyl-CoA reductase/sulfur reductase-like enzyme